MKSKSTAIRAVLTGLTLVAIGASPSAAADPATAAQGSGTSRKEPPALYIPPDMKVCQASQLYRAHYARYYLKQEKAQERAAPTQAQGEDTSLKARAMRLFGIQ